MLRDEIIQLGAKGGPLPEGLNPAETFLFLSMRSLYYQARHKIITKEQGSKEKKELIRQYEKMALWVNIVEEHRRKEMALQGAWTSFAQDPSPENAKRLHEAWYRCGFKINIDENKD